MFFCYFTLRNVTVIRTRWITLYSLYGLVVRALKIWLTPCNLDTHTMVRSDLLVFCSRLEAKGETRLILVHEERDHVWQTRLRVHGKIQGQASA